MRWDEVWILYDRREGILAHSESGSGATSAHDAYGWFFASGPGEANVGIFLRTSVYKQSGRTLRAWPALTLVGR